MPDRETVIDKLNDMADYLLNKSYSDLLARDFYDTVGYAIALLKEQEAEWLEVDDKHDAFDCSRCGAMVERKCLYCPGCGARMKNGSRVKWRLVPE